KRHYRLNIARYARSGPSSPTSTASCAKLTSFGSAVYPAHIGRCSCNGLAELQTFERKRARVVEWTRLENQRRGNPSVSSNLTASANYPAPMAELVDARDLKSLDHWSCRFDSGWVHHSTKTSKVTARN